MGLLFRNSDLEVRVPLNLNVLDASRTPRVMSLREVLTAWLAHQIEVLDLVTDLNRRKGTTVAIVLHDLNLVARYADHLIAMKAGEVVAEGPPSDVVTEQLVSDVFGLESRVIPDPVSGTPMVVPVGRHHSNGGSIPSAA